MQHITNIDELETLYGEAVPAAITKVVHQMTPLYRQWITQSRFVVMSTVGTGGTDGTPRGDDGPVVRIVDAQTLWMPDWRGNNRIDSLRNIVEDGRVSLMFMVPGCKNVVRVNGHAVLTADSEIANQFEQNGKHPRSVIVITIGEMYFQCAKALMRSAIWTSEDESSHVPTAGKLIAEVKAGFDGEQYDEAYPEYAKGRMW